MFNVEELSLLHVFQMESREKTIEELQVMLEHIDDDDLVVLCEQVLRKLEDMPDAEYAKLDYILDGGIEDDR